jgi:NADP-dependent 3-hydroxy acid dehydrogenase YdfG
MVSTTGKIAVITGGSAGIDLATAHLQTVDANTKG